MFYQVLSKVTSNDPKGELGGTQYNLSISKNNELIESHDYSIMDVIIGKFNPEEIKSKYIQLNKEIADQRDNARNSAVTKMKQQQLADKMSKVNVELHAVIDAVIASNGALVDQYKNGNDKVLNALVGQTMKKLKADPSVVKQLLMDKIK